VRAGFSGDRLRVTGNARLGGPPVWGGARLSLRLRPVAHVGFLAFPGTGVVEFTVPD
jgi:hypothetical protein